jgi:hypothetical protein
MAMSTYLRVHVNLDGHNCTLVDTLARSVVRFANRKDVLKVDAAFLVQLPLSRIRMFVVDRSKNRISGRNLLDKVISHFDKARDFLDFEIREMLFDFNENWELWVIFDFEDRKLEGHSSAFQARVLSGGWKVRKTMQLAAGQEMGGGVATHLARWTRVNLLMLSRRVWLCLVLLGDDAMMMRVREGCVRRIVCVKVWGEGRSWRGSFYMPDAQAR